MLEKFSKKDKNFLFDAHFHYAVCKDYGIDLPVFENGIEWSGISCAHSKKEFEIQCEAPSRKSKLHSLSFNLMECILKMQQMKK